MFLGALVVVVVVVTVLSPLLVVRVRGGPR